MNIVILSLFFLLTSCNVVKLISNSETNLDKEFFANDSNNLLNDSKFISKWRTTTPSESVTLPLRSGYNYSFTVDWGDGSSITSVNSWNAPGATHIYDVAGDYTISISGTLEAFYFNNSGDKDKLIEVNSFGDMGWINLESAFLGCTNLTSFSGGVTTTVINMKNMFYNTPMLSSVDVSTFDTSSVTNMSSMFRGMPLVSNLNLTHFNTTNVTDMSSMFEGTTSLTSLNISSFDTSSVTSMSGMFKQVGVSSIDLSNFNTSSVTSMGNMFRSTGFTSLDLSNFDTSSVTVMSNMFLSMGALTSLNTTGWDISAVSSSTGIFTGTSSVVVTCNQGGPPASGTFFGKSCN